MDHEPDRRTGRARQQGRARHHVAEREMILNEMSRRAHVLDRADAHSQAFGEATSISS